MKGIGLAQVAASGAHAAAENDRTRVQRAAVNAKARHSQHVTEARDNQEQIQSEVEAIKSQNDMLIRKQAKIETFDALRMYTKTDNPMHLTKAAQNNPMIRKVLGGFASIEPLNYDTDHNLLTKAGVTAEQFSPFRHLKAVMPDGTAQLFDMQEIMGGTGFLNTLANEELDLLIKQKKLFDIDKSDDKPGPLERDTNYLASQGHGSTKEISGALYQERIAGNKAGQVDIANEASALLDSEFNGKYFETDFTNIDNRLKALPHIRKIEMLSGAKLSATDRTDLKDLGTLVSMADLSSETLTPEVTGILDSTYRKVKTYTSSSVAEVDKIQAQSAYAAFRNTVRHALFGSALTDGEIAAFNEAFGTLKQKYPAVVTQFKTALEQTKSKLSTINNINDPYVAKFYMGNGAAKLDEVIARLDERIEMIAEHEQTGATQVPNPPPAEKAQAPAADTPQAVPSKPDFNSIFGPKPGAN